MDGTKLSYLLYLRNHDCGEYNNEITINNEKLEIKIHNLREGFIIPGEKFLEKNFADYVSSIRISSYDFGKS